MSWNEFITQLVSLEHSVTPPIWRMSDGQSFRQPLPRLESDNDEQFIRGDAGSRYKLYDVVEMEFEPAAASKEEVRPPAVAALDAQHAAQLEAIEQAARTSGLIYRRKPERITVRSPYAC
jgi:hypothetical protein